MTDIVDRLRGFGWPLTEEAAKEIERLRTCLHAATIVDPDEYAELERDAQTYRLMQEKKSAEYSKGILG